MKNRSSAKISYQPEVMLLPRKVTVCISQSVGLQKYEFLKTRTYLWRVKKGEKERQILQQSPEILPFRFNYHQ